MTLRRRLPLLLIPLALSACGGDAGFQNEVDGYLADYGKSYQKLSYDAQLADCSWPLNEWLSEQHRAWQATLPAL